VWCNPVHLGPRLLVNWPPPSHPLPILSPFQIPDTSGQLCALLKRHRDPGFSWSGTVMYSKVWTEDQCNGFNAIWFILLKQMQHYLNLILHAITLLQSSFLKIAHSLHASPSSSHPTCPSFFFLLHVASFLAGCWLLIFSNSWGAGPSLTPLPQADPSSFRSQAMPRFHVGHSNIKFFSRLKVTHMFSCKCLWIYFERSVDAKNPNPTSALRDKLPGILLFYMWKCIKLIRFPRPAGQKKIISIVLQF
jgi:hypothetical protein